MSNYQIIQIMQMLSVCVQSYVIGGFFKCCQEQWENYERAEDVTESLPTVDVDGECISPVSE